MWKDFEIGKFFPTHIAPKTKPQILQAMHLEIPRNIPRIGRFDWSRDCMVGRSGRQFLQETQAAPLYTIEHLCNCCRIRAAPVDSSKGEKGARAIDRMPGAS